MHLYLYNTFELIHLGSWPLNLNAFQSRSDVLKTTLILISLLQLLKMFASWFLASNDIFTKYSKDIAVLEFRIRLMNNLFKNLWIHFVNKK